MAITRVDTTDPSEINWHLRLMGDLQIELDAGKFKDVKRMRINTSTPADEEGDWLVLLLFDDKENCVFRRQFRR